MENDSAGKIKISEKNCNNKYAKKIKNLEKLIFGDFCEKKFKR